MLGAIKKQWKALPPKVRTAIGVTFKLAITVVAFYALLTHKIGVHDSAPDIQAYFEKTLPANLAHSPGVAKDVGGVYQFDIKGEGGGTWSVDLTKDSDWVSKGAAANPQAVVAMTGPDFAKVVEGKLGLKTAIKEGQLEAGGDAALIPKLDRIFTRKMTIFSAIKTYLPQIKAEQFWFWCILAGAIKLVGVVFSAWGWHLLLKGQQIVFPFWRQIMTSWLIGRFIGTFMPSTIGLDGYTLYDAGKYSQKWERVALAKGLEKFIGVTGLFLCMLLLLPFGVGIFGDRALLMGGIVGAVAGSIVLAVFIGTFRPGILQYFLRLPFPMRSRVETQVNRLEKAAGAYRDKPKLLLMVFFAKFMTHFTTAVVYVFTALAVGVVDVQFFDVTFASSIQILGTLFSPTIAGEGAREMIQAYLLGAQMGVVQSILSAALGFIAAEAATLWGGLFWWGRRGNFRPAFTLVDGEQVNHDAVDSDDGPGADSNKPLGSAALAAS